MYLAIIYNQLSLGGKGQHTGGRNVNFCKQNKEFFDNNTKGWIKTINCVIEQSNNIILGLGEIRVFNYEWYKVCKLIKLARRIPVT